MNTLKLKKTIGLALCLTVLLVVGCAVGDKQIQEAMKACEPHGGVNYIWGEFKPNRNIDVVCVNGAKIEKDISSN